MRRIEIKPWINEDGKEVSAIFMDGEVFDWGLVDDGLRKASIYARLNPSSAKSICADIHQHFISSFSEFVGREVTLKEVIEAIEKGQME